MNIQLMDRLIEHYRGQAGVTGWSYEVCPSGRLRAWGVTNSLDPEEVARVLDISDQAGMHLVAGPGLNMWLRSPEKNRDIVVSMLGYLRATGRVDWDIFPEPV